MSSEFLIPSFTKEGEKVNIKLRIMNEINSFEYILKQVRNFQQNKGLKISPLAIKQLRKLQTISAEYELPMTYVCEFVFPKIEK